MPNLARWSVLNRIVLSVLMIYSALLCAISSHVFFTAVREGSPLNFASIAVQTLTTLFLPLLILGIWKPRLTSAIFAAAAAVILAVTFVNAHAAASETAGGGCSNNYYGSGFASPNKSCCRICFCERSDEYLCESRPGPQSGKTG